VYLVFWGGRKKWKRLYFGFGVRQDCFGCDSFLPELIAKSACLSPEPIAHQTRTYPAFCSINSKDWWWWFLSPRVGQRNCQNKLRLSKPKHVRLKKLKNGLRNSASQVRLVLYPCIVLVGEKQVGLGDLLRDWHWRLSLGSNGTHNLLVQTSHFSTVPLLHLLSKMCNWDSYFIRQKQQLASTNTQSQVKNNP
jgi:hypothetical protein